MHILPYIYILLKRFFFKLKSKLLKNRKFFIFFIRENQWRSNWLCETSWNRESKCQAKAAINGIGLWKSEKGFVWPVRNIEDQIYSAQKLKAANILILK